MARQRVTLPCDNTTTSHPATNPRRPYVKRCIRHVNCIDHVACLTRGSLMSKSRHSDPTHHRFTHTSVGHSVNNQDSTHPQAIHASCHTRMSPKPWRHIYIPNVPHNRLCIARGRSPCVPASEYLSSHIRQGRTQAKSIEYCQMPRLPTA